MRPRHILPRLLKGIAVAAVLLWSLAPIGLILSSSFKPERDIFAFPPRFLLIFGEGSDP